MATTGIAAPQTLEGGTPAKLPTTIPDATIADWYKASPYSQSAPTVGLVDSQVAAPQVAAPDTTKNVATIDPNQFDPNTAVKSTMTGAQGTSIGYDASKATATNWSVDPNQTVEGRVTGLIDSDSPLMQQARTQALQAQNGKGLLNSSMAVGAGQGAVIAAATPIATSDAATYANSAKYNADTANTTSQFNAGADNTAAQFTAGAKNTQELANQSSTNTAGQVNTTQQNALQSQMLQQQGTVAQANQAATNAATAQTAALSLQAQTVNQTAAVQQAAQVYDNAVKMAMQNADAAGKLQLQQIDASTRTNLADIQAQYNVKMQASASMAQTYQAYTNQMAAIMTDPNLDGAGKQTALDNMTQLLRNAMAMQSSVSGLDLGTIEDSFKSDNLDTKAATPGLVGAPAPAPPYDDSVGRGA